MSFKKRTWLPAEQQTRITGNHGLHPLVTRILETRGVTDDTLGVFLDPTLRNSMPDPEVLRDMTRAAERLAQAILNEETISIWSDYDCDGAGSAAVLLRFLRSVGVNATLHIPDRIHDGYGPNAKGLMTFAEQGTTLMLILDSGTSAHEPLAAIANTAMDVVIVDHHMPGDSLPAVHALVNPKRADDTSGLSYMCAAGLTFMLCVATRMALLRVGGDDIVEKVDLKSLLPIVALSTVCDVVPLVGLNRAIVRTGLALMETTRFVGLNALADKAGISKPFSTRDCGFGFGPRINAGGRIGDSKLGALLLSTDDEGEAEVLAEHLCDLNSKRKEMEAEATAQALDQLSHMEPGQGRDVAIAVVEGHEGIVGISAARLKEAVDRPAFVLALTEEGFLKGSGRSVDGFNLGEAVIAAVKAGILVKGGGHDMAAGITLMPERLEEFRAFLNARISESRYAKQGVPVVFDADASVSDITTGFVQSTRQLEPFGTANPQPVFLVRHARLVEVRVMKEKHIKLILDDPHHGGLRVEAPMWNTFGTPFAEWLQDQVGKPLDLIATLDVNEWNGRKTVQMTVEDARPSEGPKAKTVVKEEAIF